MVTQSRFYIITVEPCLEDFDFVLFLFFLFLMWRWTFLIFIWCRKALVFYTLEVQSLIWYKIKFAFYSGKNIFCMFSEYLRPQVQKINWFYSQSACFKIVTFLCFLKDKLHILLFVTANVVWYFPGGISKRNT